MVSHQICSIKEGVVKYFAKFTGKHQCQSLFYNKVASPKKSFEFCKTFKYTFFMEGLHTTAFSCSTISMKTLIKQLKRLQIYSVIKNGPYFGLELLITPRHVRKITCFEV